MSLIGALLFFALVGGFLILFTPRSDQGSIMLYVALQLAELLGLILVLRNGTLIRTIYFKLMICCIPMIWIAAMAIYMGWAGGVYMATNKTVFLFIIAAIRCIRAIELFLPVTFLAIITNPSEPMTRVHFLFRC